MDDEISVETCSPEDSHHMNEEIVEAEDSVECHTEDQIITHEDIANDITSDVDTEQITADEVENEDDPDYEDSLCFENDADFKGESSPETVKSLVVVADDLNASKSDEAYDVAESSDSHPDSLSQETDEKLLSRLKAAEANNAELELRLSLFEERFNELHGKMNETLDSNGNLLSSIQTNLETRADETEFKRLKNDFDLFAKRLKRVVQAEDSVNAESLDATKVPPDVLEITYAKTLNDIYSAMLGIYGDRESSEMVEDARESVRQFSAGVDFFRFENESFVVRGLSEAIASKIVSVKQIHGTYVELFKMLFQYVPNYNSQDFRSFVETGSREYTIEKVVSHEQCIDRIVSDVKVFRDELSNITENVSFIAELQNNQLEETASNSQELEDIKEQMKSVAKAINLHTKAISKLNKTLVEFQNSSAADNNISHIVDIPDIDMSRIEEMFVSKASKEEIVSVSDEIESFKADVESTFSSMQQQLQENILDSQKLQGIEDKLSGMQKELHDLNVIVESQPENLQSNMEMSSFVVEESSLGMEDMQPVLEDSQPKRLSDIPIEDVITGQLSVLGSATLKQLEKQINENGYSIDFEKLSLVMSYLEQEQIVSSTKKGRYTFYSVTNLMSV